ncbi:chemotaxis protein CheW [Chloroflexota bacterium]
MSVYEKFSERELAILKARAERVASELQEDADSSALTALLVTMQGETYALPIDEIRVVHENILVEPIPCVPPYVAGMANVRGHILPVIDLAMWLGLKGRPINGPVSLIAVGTDDVNVAFYVESIGEVLALSLDKLATVPVTSTIERTMHLQGVLPDGTVVLNVAAILTDPSIVVDDVVG